MTLSLGSICRLRTCTNQTCHSRCSCVTTIPNRMQFDSSLDLLRPDHVTCLGVLSLFVDATYFVVSMRL